LYSSRSGVPLGLRWIRLVVGLLVIQLATAAGVAVRLVAKISGAPPAGS
jgi:hypothetical protein